MDWTILLIGFLIGLLSGGISGAFGIGASSIKIVLLRVFLGIPADVAIATALPLSIPAALGGSVIYHGKHMIKYRTALMCGASGAVLSVLGAFATEFVPGEFLMVGVGLVLIASAYLVMEDRKRGEWRGYRKRCGEQTNEEKVGYSLLAGGIAGFASGFLGIGGGIILVPLLARLRKMPYKKTIPCSLFVMLLYIVPASVAHFGLGNVDIPLLLSMGLGSAIGALVGAKKAMKLKEEDVQKWFVRILVLFGTLLLAREAWMYWFV